MTAATKVTSLWPEDLIPSDPLSTPAKIVREQADVLEERTDGDLIAEVRSTNGRPGDKQFAYSFEFFVPALDYRYALFGFHARPRGVPGLGDRERRDR